jgi:predicted MFS family arabinose efflux permease
MFATLRNRDFALLWTAGLISVAGDFALLTALPLHAYALTGSAVATGGVFAASLLPRALLGSVAGVFVDRWDRRRTMVAADLLRALLLLPLLLVGAPGLVWLIYASRAATGTVGLFFDPAENALLPRLVGEDRLVAANALNALNNNLGRLVGPVIGGLAYARWGLGVAVLLDVATFLLSAALVAAIRTPSRPARADGADHAAATAFERAAAEWRDGVRIVGRDRVLLTIFVALALGFVGEGTFEVGFSPLVIDALAVGATGAGVLMAAQAIGGIAAGGLVSAASSRLSPRLQFGLGLNGLGVCDAGMTNAGTLATPGTPALVAASAFMLLAGFPVVALNAASNTLVQVRVADAYRGRVFGALGAIGSLATLVGLAVGGVAIDAVGVVPVLSAGAAMWVVGGAFALLRIPPGADQPATLPASGAAPGP